MRKYAIAMKLDALPNPLAARLACCIKPFMASTYALLRAACLRCYSLLALARRVVFILLDTPITALAGVSHCCVQYQPSSGNSITAPQGTPAKGS